MSAKKQESQVEAVRNAATGYAVVVLATVCFIIALAVIMAGVRVVASITASATPVATTTVVNSNGGAT